jgi:branched-chain amino acid transport system permease protein
MVRLPQIALRRPTRPQMPALPGLGQRERRLLLGLLALAAIVAWPWALPLPLAIVTDAVRAGEYAIVAVSLVLLTGWVGQISLAQGAFVGVGAFVTALVFRRANIPFPASLPFAVAASALVAVLLGIVALRVRGLYLAVATLIFAWMADAFLFSASWLVGAGGSATLPTGVIGKANTFVSFDLHDPRIFYLVIAAGLGLSIYAASNLRDSKTGRAFFAVRGSEMAAVSLGIDVTRYKLLAFGISGAIAGLAGHLQIVGDGSAVPAEFNFLTSLFFLSIAVVGGLTSLGGAVAAGVLFSALNEVFFRVTALNGYIDIVAALLLLTVLIVYPGGLSAAGRTAAQRVVNAFKAVVTRRSGAGIDEDGAEIIELPERRDNGSGQASTADAPAAEQVSLLDLISKAKPQFDDRMQLEPVLEANGVTVRFGGLTAVNNVSLMVRTGEIVGLIGPNGAGKTTLFNAIAGLNEPTSGTVHIFGKDATKLPVHARAALGVGRTFQLIQLFPQLSVFDNLLAATHLQNPTGFLQHLVVSERALYEERVARDRVMEIIDRLGLHDVAQRTVTGLPFGVLRIVELARALVTGAPFVMLDEPASGLDDGETQKLADLLLTLRNDMDITFLLIEHDVAMVTSVTDYMYVINRGQLLAEGTPAEIQQNEDVIAAYLGQPAGNQGVAEEVGA